MADVLRIAFIRAEATGDLSVRQTNFCRENVTQRPSVSTRHQQGLHIKTLCFRNGFVHTMVAQPTNSHGPESMASMESKKSLQCSQQPIIGTHPQPNKWSPSSQYIYFRCVLIVSLDLRLSIPSGHFTFRLSDQNSLCSFHLSHMCYVSHHPP